MDATAEALSDVRKFANKPQPTGWFSLVSVVTHQGRYADSGHYVGWQFRPAAREERTQQVDEGAAAQTERLGGGPPANKKPKPVAMWVKFDDDKVSEVPWESADLSGGRSDYHVAYLLLLKQVMITPTEEEVRAVSRLLHAPTNQPNGA